MRIKHTDPEAEKVIAVLVDGKRVATPIEADDEEGWCLAAVPIDAEVKMVEEVDAETDNPEETSYAQWKEVKLTGKVEIILKEE